MRLPWEGRKPKFTAGPLRSRSAVFVVLAVDPQRGLSACREAGRAGEIKIVTTDRNDDLLPYIEDGTIVGAVAQASA